MAADMQFSDDDSPFSSINVTPFVDVVLVLLVIFMVTAPALLKDMIGIQLPKAATSEAKPSESLSIAITRQGQLLVNGKMASAEELATEVAAAVKRHPETQAIIAADSDARHGDVVRAIDIVKQAGLKKFAIQIEREK